MKRIFGVVLVAVLMLNLLTFVANAETEPTEQTEASTQSEATESTEATASQEETAPAETTESTQPLPDAKPVLSASDEVIGILKLEEGFSSKPYWDYAQWTVGYGTRCPDDKLEEYKQNGIPEEEAEALLRNFVMQFESELHGLMVRTGLELNQNQFDALLLFSFNCGSGWTHTPSGGIYKAVVNGATGNELIDALTRWCNAGGKIQTYLLRRRQSEANMYLNGVYSQTPPEDFGYVLYDACGGKTSPNVQGYHTGLTAKIIPTPTYEGYTFDGWYTEKTGGKKVEVLDASVRNSRLYAHWLDAAGNDANQPQEDGVKVTVTANSVNVRSGPGTDYDVVGSADTGDVLNITETAEGSGYTWGKFRDGWICLKYTNYDIVAPSEPEEPGTQQVKTGTVRVNDTLRVRSGPSTGYDVVAYLRNGDKVEILEEKLVGSMVWGRTEAGWVSMDYVVIADDQTENEGTVPPATEPEETTPPVIEPEETVPPATEPEETTPPETEPETPEANYTPQTGTVKVSDVLRVRSGPSTNDAIVGYLKNGQRVTVTEKTTSGATAWGKVEQGWISLDYVVIDVADDQPQNTVKGTVTVSDLLRVRSGPGTSYAISAYLEDGTKVEITEQRDVNGMTWGKMAKGWISMSYVQLEEDTAPVQPQTQTKTVTADCLRVRSAAGTDNSVVGYLYQGAKVEILETATANGVTWGKTSQGWISMEYVK